MAYLSYGFFALLLIALVLYYLIPRPHQWKVLLCASICFYIVNVRSVSLLLLFAAMVTLSFLAGILLERHTNKWLLLSFVAICASPLIIFKITPLIFRNSSGFSLILPLGCAFFTMQIIAYMVDVYYGRVNAQKNLLRYYLFITFFPQIIQGPIPRYNQLSGQLFCGHSFAEDNIVRGYRMILWGTFLKLVVADRLAVVVDTVFNHYPEYLGAYVFVAGVGYSLQLYSDFLSCSIISKGVSRLFGIEIMDNFARPYFSQSIVQFWRRWHISLSTWFRDYVYIPLGGSQTGRMQGYSNLIITFLLSGLWHGNGYRYIFWGLMHAGYQVSERLFAPLKEKLFNKLEFYEGTLIRCLIQVIVTDFLVMIGWIVFRARTIRMGITMIASMFTTYNPWVLVDGSLAKLGLDWKEWNVIIVGIAALVVVSAIQEKQCIGAWIDKQHIIIRWCLYLAVFFAIVIFGRYGEGYDAKNFIYGQF